MQCNNAQILHAHELYHEWIFKYPTCAGLINLGNSCFLNSTLQALYHTPTFVNWLMFNLEHELKCTTEKTMCITCIIKETLQLCHENSGSAIKPYKLFNMLNQISNEFVQGQQADCHELFMYLLAVLDREHQSLRKNDSSVNNPLPMDHIFGGNFYMEYECLECHSVSVSTERFQSISIDICDDKINSLDDALDHYFRNETFANNDYTCMNCQRKVTLLKKTFINHAPHVLCIQLKRFDARGQKIMKNLNISETVHLERYTQTTEASSMNKGISNYSLTSVVAHIGSTIACGHYIAVAKESSGEFYTFNDSQVHHTSINNVLNNKDAYILIYAKMTDMMSDKENSSLLSNIYKEANIEASALSSELVSSELQIRGRSSKPVQTPTNTVQKSSKENDKLSNVMKPKVSQSLSTKKNTKQCQVLRKKQLAAVATSLICLTLARSYKQKKNWERPLFKMRKQHGCFHTNFQLLKNDPEKFRNYTRMSLEQFNKLSQIIDPMVRRKTCVRDPISTDERLLLTLRYLASGELQIAISYSFNISPTAVSNIVAEVCEAIWEGLRPIVLKQCSVQDWRDISLSFAKKCHFPHVVGAIDGKHVTMEAPANAGSEYYNYKGHHSIILLAVSDADYIFRYVDIGATGRQSDGGVFTKSNIWKIFETDRANIPPKEPLGEFELPYVMVGDAAFPLTDYLLVPYPTTNKITPEQRVYNYRHRYARRVVENAFGILASQWRIYRRPINCCVDTTIQIVKATVCLHNWLRMADVINQQSYYTLQSSIKDSDCTGSSCLVPLRRTSRTVYQAGVQLRNDFCEYFNSEGSLSWQYKYI